MSTLRTTYKISSLPSVKLGKHLKTQLYLLVRKLSLNIYFSHHFIQFTSHLNSGSVAMKFGTCFKKALQDTYENFHLVMSLLL